MADLIAAYSIGHEYIQRVRGVYGVWVELSHAMGYLCDSYEKLEATNIAELLQVDPTLEGVETNKRVQYPHIVNGEVVFTHYTCVQDIIDMNSAGGPNR